MNRPFFAFLLVFLSDMIDFYLISDEYAPKTCLQLTHAFCETRSAPFYSALWVCKIYSGPAIVDAENGFDILARFDGRSTALLDSHIQTKCFE